MISERLEVYFFKIYLFIHFWLHYVYMYTFRRSKQHAVKIKALNYDIIERIVG